MRLALKVGRLDWRNVLRELSPQDLLDWMAFERIEPFGQEWHQASMVASVVANELRIIASGIGGQKVQSDDLYGADTFVPGVAERLARDEATANEKALKGLIGL